MLRKTFWSLALGTAAGLLAAGNASWAASSEPPLRLLSSVPIPVAAGNTTGGMFSFDISYVDQATGDYYLADRSNKAVDRRLRRVDRHADHPEQRPRPVRGDLRRASFTGANDCAGPNGVVAAFPWLFVTDAPSRVLSFDLRFNPPQTVSECTTKGRRAYSCGRTGLRPEGWADPGDQQRRIPAVRHLDQASTRRPALSPAERI